VGRSLGQHFLADRGILDSIVAALAPTPADVVLEVGAGTGTLTRRLALRVGRVIAIEKDRRLVARLRATVADADTGPLPPNVDVVQGDALTLDWHALVRHSPFKVAGNIPYYLTSPLIDKALTVPLPDVVVYLVQREVAQRLASPPGSRTFGALTAGVAAVAVTERLLTVPPGAFRPPPRVGSAVVRITPRREPMVALTGLPAYRSFLAAVFGQRRKQLSRSLRNLFGLDRVGADAVLLSAGVRPAQRPEMLTPQELVRLFMALRCVDGRTGDP